MKCSNHKIPLDTIDSYKNHRFLPEIIAHAVWLYHRFSLSFREVDELLAERGVIVSYQAVRLWSLKFGQTFAKKLRYRRGCSPVARVRGWTASKRRRPKIKAKIASRAR